MKAFLLVLLMMFSFSSWGQENSEPKLTDPNQIATILLVNYDFNNQRSSGYMKAEVNMIGDVKHWDFETFGYELQDIEIEPTASTDNDELFAAVHQMMEANCRIGKGTGGFPDYIGIEQFFLEVPARIEGMTTDESWGRIEWTFLNLGDLQSFRELERLQVKQRTDKELKLISMSSSFEVHISQVESGIGHSSLHKILPKMIACWLGSMVVD